MTQIDQFESVFRAADKPVFVPEKIAFRRYLVISDLAPDAAESFATSWSRAFPGVDSAEPAELTVWGEHDLKGVESVLTKIAELEPDLICTYRNLMIPASSHPYSLGVYLDVLTQATDIPVLVVPRPGEGGQGITQPFRRVMAMTDHLTGAHRLVNVAAHCVVEDGELWLAHVEDHATLERYLRTIERIPELDTDVARDKLQKQLLKEPHDYVRSCQTILSTFSPKLHVRESVIMGCHLSDYRRLVREHNVELLVTNTKDDDQLAMHGQAYPLTVELRSVPLLLL